MATSTRGGRSQTVSYADLMKPDEDWRNLPDAAERRKIQNRLAQRAYRRNMRDRTKEVERLKKQLKQLQESNDQDKRTKTPPPEQEMTPIGRSPSSRDAIQAGHTDPTTSMSVISFLPGGYPPVRSVNLKQEPTTGLGMTHDPDNTLTSSQPPPFLTIAVPEDYRSIQGLSSPAYNAPEHNQVGLSPPVVPPVMPDQHQLMRSTGNPTCFPTRCPSPPLSPWVQAGHHDAHVQAISASQSPLLLDPNTHRHLLSLPPTNFSLHAKPDDLPYLRQEPPYCHGDEFNQAAAYSTPAESDMGASWTSDGIPACVPSRPSSASTFHSQMSTADLTHSVQETNATLVHLAVSGGHIDTLHLLLHRFGASINHRDQEGLTPLQRAVMIGRTDIVALLLQHGAYMNGDEGIEIKQENGQRIMDIMDIKMNT